MAEDLQTGPVPPQRRPAIGARLAMGFLAVVRVFLFFPAIAMVLAAAVMILAVCFFEEDVSISLIRILGTIAFAEVMIGAAVGAKYLRDEILSRYAKSAAELLDPVSTCGHEVVLMIEIVLTACGLALLLWIPAEISRMRDIGIVWPLTWAVIGGSALFARHLLVKWLDRRSLIADTYPCSTPGTPPSGEP
jgi:hypothetical protein